MVPGAPSAKSAATGTKGKQSRRRLDRLLRTDHVPVHRAFFVVPGLLVQMGAASQRKIRQAIAPG